MIITTMKTVLRGRSRKRRRRRRHCLLSSTTQASAYE
jgi:hypothetical protein